MRALYVASANRVAKVSLATRSGSYIRHPMPSGREQMALICSDRDRLASRKKAQSLTTEMCLCDIRSQIR